MSIVIRTAHIVQEDQKLEPNAEHPFIVVTKAGQPIDLIAYHPWAGAPPPPGAKTAAILVIQNITEDLRVHAQQALSDARDAEGVILVGANGEVLGVLPTAEVLSGLDGSSRGLGSSNYESFNSSEVDIQTSRVFSCPKLGCSSPDITIYQKGQDVPNCPIHNKPRIPRLIRRI